MRPEERARFHTCSDLRTATPAGDWIELVPEEGRMAEVVAFSRHARVELARPVDGLSRGESGAAQAGVRFRGRRSHRLYLAVGFRPGDPYPESEIPVEFHDRWLFMRRDLADTNPAS